MPVYPNNVKMQGNLGGEQMIAEENLLSVQKDKERSIISARDEFLWVLPKVH